MRITIVAACVLLYAAPLLAETYSWVDDNGTYNFTEDYSSIPKKYRKKMEKRGDMGGGVPVKESAPVPVAVKDAAAAAPVEKGVSSAGNFGGKTYDQWKQDLQQRESSMWEIRKRIDVLDESLNKPGLDRVQQRTGIQERNDLARQLTEMRKEYDVTVDAARKVGISVEIK